MRGAAAQQLLQGQITADAATLALGEVAMAALCTNKGRVVSVFHIFRDETGFMLRLPRDNLEPLRATLTKYAPFYRGVELIERTDLAIFAMQDAPADWVAPEAGIEIVHAPNLREYWIERTQVPSAFAQACDANKSSADCKWLRLRVNRGWPAVHPATSETFLPHAISLDLANAISFKKGCYTGQEIIARTHYRGKTKKRLALLQVGALAMPAGTALTSPNGDDIGTLVESVDALAGGSDWLVSLLEPEFYGGPICAGGTELVCERRPLPWQQ